MSYRIFFFAAPETDRPANRRREITDVLRHRAREEPAAFLNARSRTTY